MKNFKLTLVLLFLASVGYSQYKPMNGYYQWNGNLRFNDTLFVDSASISIPAGTADIALALDTTGVSSTGYYRVISTSVITGTGESLRVPFFSDESTVTTAAGLVYDEANQILEVRRVGNQATTAGLGLFYENFKRISVDSNLTIFNDNANNGRDILFLTPNDTVLNLDVSTDRVGINMQDSEFSNTTLNIGANNSDTALHFYEVPFSTGANSPTFNTSPYNGTVNYLHIKATLGGVERNGVIPVIFE